MVANGVRRGAHCLVWEYTYGPVPDGLHVLHRCDNPPCCNPEHLFLGTPLDNMRDKVAKGRHANTQKTHCPQGHPYMGDNLRIERGGGRRCRVCHKIEERRRRRATGPRPD